MRVAFFVRLAVQKYGFVFTSNGLRDSEISYTHLVVFFWYEQEQEGTGVSGVYTRFPFAKWVA